MALASFPLIIKRWKRSYLFHDNYQNYSQLEEYLPKQDFEARLKTLDKHVQALYPHIWVDTYLFLVAITFVIGTAAFSVAARAVNLSTWYPLILLSIPALVAFITTRRRNGYYIKLNKYYESLQTCLKEFNSLDVTRQVKWSFRRLRDTDIATDFHLPNRLKYYNINFVIDITQINPEVELAEEGEILPAYDTSMMDVVLDMGPVMERVPGNTSEHLDSRDHHRPPSYHPTIELDSITTPPPAYLNQENMNNNVSNRTNNM